MLGLKKKTSPGVLGKRKRTKKAQSSTISTHTTLLVLSVVGGAIFNSLQHSKYTLFFLIYKKPKFLLEPWTFLFSTC